MPSWESDQTDAVTVLEKDTTSGSKKHTLYEYTVDKKGTLAVKEVFELNHFAKVSKVFLFDEYALAVVDDSAITVVHFRDYKGKEVPFNFCIDLVKGNIVDVVVTSPLERAADSASRIAARLGVEVCEDPDLEEVRFGHWQGLSYEEIVSHEDYRAFAADPTRNPTPGGETIVQVQGRGLAAVGRAAPGERVVFVSHGDIIRAILSHYLAVPLDEFRRIRVDNCGLSAITSRRGRAEVKFVNLLADPDRAWEPLHWSKKVSAPTS